MDIKKAKVIFSSHMAAAQKRKLTTYERGQLVRAQVVLRRSRRQNPHRKSGTPKLKFKDVQAKIRRLGFSFNKTEAGDYRVGTGREESSYYASDLADALGTAVAMAERRLRGNPGKSTRRLSRNKVAKIYTRVLRIEAQKTGAHHCDKECRACKHKYFHDFKVHPQMIGLSPGQVFKVPAGCWPLVIMC